MPGYDISSGFVPELSLEYLHLRPCPNLKWGHAALFFPVPLLHGNLSEWFFLCAPVERAAWGGEVQLRWFPLRIRAWLIKVHSLLQQPQLSLDALDTHSLLLNLFEGALVPESQQLTFQISCFMKARQAAFISYERVFAF